MYYRTGTDNSIRDLESEAYQATLRICSKDFGSLAQIPNNGPGLIRLFPFVIVATSWLSSLSETTLTVLILSVSNSALSLSNSLLWLISMVTLMIIFNHLPTKIQY